MMLTNTYIHLIMENTTVLMASVATAMTILPCFLLQWRQLGNFSSTGSELKSFISTPLKVVFFNHRLYLITSDLFKKECLIFTPQSSLIICMTTGNENTFDLHFRFSTFSLSFYCFITFFWPSILFKAVKWSYFFHFKCHFVFTNKSSSLQEWSSSSDFSAFFSSIRLQPASRLTTLCF